jgi:hypothetical protein
MSKLTDVEKKEIIKLKANGQSNRKIARELLGNENRDKSIRRFLKGLQTSEVQTVVEEVEEVSEGLEEVLKRVTPVRKNKRLPVQINGRANIMRIRYEEEISIFVISDLQVTPDISLDYCRELGAYLARKQPDVIVCIGDLFDLESLSFYDKGKRAFEGRRLIKDIEAGKAALKLITDPLKAVKGYEPELHVTLGNHEDRIQRLANDQPELEGFVGTHCLGYEDFGFTVHPFLKPVEIQGILFSHYFANEFTGKPVGGNAKKLLDVIGQSFVAGHQQKLDMAVKNLYIGDMQVGVVCGAGYAHDEAYKGYCGNNHFRGHVMINEVLNGFGVASPVSINHIKNSFKKYS